MYAFNSVAWAPVWLCRPAKKARLSLEEVITELEEEDDQFIEYGLEVDGPMMAGSDDELEDLQFEEREREYLEREEEEFQYDEEMDDEGDVLEMMTGEGEEEREQEGEQSEQQSEDTEEERDESEEEREDSEGEREEIEESEDRGEEERDGGEGNSDESEDEGEIGLKWHSILKSVTVHPFAEQVGPTFDVSPSPSAVFKQFFTDDICAHIVEQSNLYAHQVLGSEKYSKWNPITVEELRAYFGFRICMGIVHLPAMRHYWSHEPLLHQPAIADHISRDRFFDISRFLHFANNTTLPA